MARSTIPRASTVPAASVATDGESGPAVVEVLDLGGRGDLGADRAGRQVRRPRPGCRRWSAPGARSQRGAGGRLAPGEQHRRAQHVEITAADGPRGVVSGHGAGDGSGDSIPQPTPLAEESRPTARSHSRTPSVTRAARVTRRRTRGGEAPEDRRPAMGSSPDRGDGRSRRTRTGGARASSRAASTARTSVSPASRARSRHAATRARPTPRPRALGATASVLNSPWWSPRGQLAKR